MSSTTVDVYTVCITCSSFDCDIDSHCNECNACLEDHMVAYVQRRLNLEGKSSCP